MADNRRIPKWLKAQGYNNVPEFYKNLGLDAVESYLRMKRRGGSTKHWTLPYGDYKFVFFDCIPRTRVIARVKSIRKSGMLYPADPVLNMLSLNKPLNYEYRR